MTDNLEVGPLWEPGLRFRLATLCMAAVAGKEGDMAVVTDQIIEFCRTLSGEYDKSE